MYRKVALSTLLMALTIWLASCGGSGGDGDGDGNGGNGGMDPSTPLIGYWQPIDATGSGTVRVATALDWDAAWTNATYRLNQNGTFVREAFTNATRVATDNGTWNTDNGVGWMEIDGVRTTINSSTAWQDVATLSLTRGGLTYGVRMAAIRSLTDHDQALSRTWRIQSVQVDGAAMNLNTFFAMDPDSDAMTVQLLPDGTGIARELDGDYVVDDGEGTWASGGATAVASIPAPLNWLERAIYEPGGLLIVSFFDRESGRTVRIELNRWAPDDTRNAALVGTWRGMSATVNGAATPLNEVLESTPATTSHYVQFWADGMMEQRAMAGADVDVAMLNWWWTRSSGQLFFDSLDPDPSTMVNYAISGSNMTVNFSEDGDDISIVFQKQ